MTDSLSKPGQSTMPVALWLCPVHFEHFYVPDDERRQSGNTVCPEDGCEEQMTRFSRTLGAKAGYGQDILP